MDGEDDEDICHLPRRCHHYLLHCVACDGPTEQRYSETHCEICVHQCGQRLWLDTCWLVVFVWIPFCQLDDDRLRCHCAYRRRNRRTREESSVGYLLGYALHLACRLAVQHRPVLRHGRPSRDPCFSNGTTCGTDLLQRSRQSRRNSVHYLRVLHHQVRHFHRHAGTGTHGFRFLARSPRTIPKSLD